MKFNKLFSWSIALAVAITLTTGPATPHNTKTPVKAGKNITKKSITFRIDTINITDANFEKLRRTVAAGVFRSHNNSVTVHYFNPQSNNARIHNFCNRNNQMIPLTARHELEHARKAHLTKNVAKYNPYTRGQIAAINEIMAPAAEIIEAIDYRFQTGHPFPASKQFIKNADSLITAATFDGLKYAPANFNMPNIADIVLENALQRFLGEVNRGFYIGTIRREMTKEHRNTYKPNSLCNTFQYILFHPNTGMWAPMWEFETQSGSTNLWFSATQAKRNRILNSVDSIINTVSGKNAYFLTNWKSR